MSGQAFIKVEVVGTSSSSISDAIASAISAAQPSVSNPAWFEVQEIRGQIVDGKVNQYQVVVKVGSKVE